MTDLPEKEKEKVKETAKASSSRIDWHAYVIIALLLLTAFLSFKVNQNNTVLAETKSELEKTSSSLSTTQAQLIELKKSFDTNMARNQALEKFENSQIDSLSIPTENGAFKPTDIFQILPLANPCDTFKSHNGGTMKEIAKQIYGDESFWKLIFYANPQVDNPEEKIPAGTPLAFPGFVSTLSEDASESEKSSIVTHEETGTMSGSPVTDRDKRKKMPISPQLGIYYILPIEHYIVHTVSEGETLKTLSEDYYLDKFLWRPIFYANDDLQTLDCLNRLVPGTQLIIPWPVVTIPIPWDKGEMESDDN
jgi:hypothetical protein